MKIVNEIRRYGLKPYPVSVIDVR